MSADTGEAPPSAVLATLASTTAVQVVTSATVLALSVLAPEIQAATGIAAGWVGYQVSLIYAAGAASSALAGSVIARFGAGRVEAIVLACLFVGLAAVLAGSTAAIALGSLVVGIGHGLNNPASSQLLHRVTPAPRRNLVFSVKQTGVPVGGIAATLALPAIAALGDWRGGLVALMVLHVGLALPFLGAHGRTPADAAATPAPVLARMRAEQAVLWASRPLRALAAIGFLFSATQLGISAFVVVMLHEAGGLSLAEAGAHAALVHGAGVVGRVGWGWLADRTGSGFGVLAAVGALCGLAAAGAMVWPALPSALGIADLALFGATAIGWNGVLLAETARAAPRGAVGAATGSVLVFVFLGAIVGPSAVGLAYAGLSDRFFAMGVLAAFSLAGAAVAWRLR